MTEERLREQVKACEQIKHTLNDKFRLINEERSAVMLRFDNLDHEIKEYRKDMRELHD